MRDDHLPEETLQQYVDGELPETKAAAVRTHLDACWRCRTRHEETVETIGEFVRYFEKANTATPSWPDLAPLLARSAQTLPDPAKPALLRWRWATGALALAAFAGAALYWQPQAPPPRQALTVPAPLPKPTPAATPVFPPGTAQKSTPPPTELYILSALYETGADLGGGVEYRQAGPGKFVVSVPPMGSKEEEALINRLKMVPGVHIAPYRAETAAPGTPLPEGSFQQAGSEPDNRLLAAAGSRQSLEKVSNAILDRSDAILLRAQALNKVDHAFPDETSLSAKDAELLTRIRTGHRKALKQDCLKQREALQPLLKPFEVSETAIQGTTNLELAQQADDALHGLLAGAPANLAPQQLAGRIAATIERLCEQLSSY